MSHANEMLNVATRLHEEALVEIEELERRLEKSKQELAALKAENEELKKKFNHVSEVRAKYVLNKLMSICPECGHDQDEDGQCANCMKVQLAAEQSFRVKCRQALHSARATFESKCEGQHKWPQEEINDALSISTTPTLALDSYLAEKTKGLQNLAEIGLVQSYGQVASEKLAGNIVKEEFWKGEVSAFLQMLSAIDAARKESK